MIGALVVVLKQEKKMLMSSSSILLFVSMFTYPCIFVATWIVINESTQTTILKKNGIPAIWTLLEDASILSPSVPAWLQ